MSFSKDMIMKHKLKLSKKYGQNFLTDESILHSIVEVGTVSSEDFVVEIGPGAGAMTRKLCEKAGFVLAVEIDAQLIPVLKEALLPFNNVEILLGDALKMQLKEKILRLKSEKQLKNLKMIANLPYYITTPLILKFLEEEKIFDKMVFMVQKEVAQRMVAHPGKKDYGALSVAVQFHTEPKITFDVPPHCFIPQPEVNSAVISLQVRREPAVQLLDEALFFKVVKAAFGQRRKTLLNALNNLGGFHLTKEKIINILESIHILPTQRGETLSLQQFAQLSNAIWESIKQKS